MKCLLEDVPGTLDAKGWRKVRCRRQGCDVAKDDGVGPTPHSFENIDSDCTAWPAAGEPGYWLVLILAAVGITQQRYIWTKQQLGLAPVCGCDQRIEGMNTIGSRFANGLTALWKFCRQLAP